MAWSKGYELRYWRKTGCEKGPWFYQYYAVAFGLNEINFRGKVIADIGCGPFGGVLRLSIFDSAEKKYPIDVLAQEYSEMDGCDSDIIYGDLSAQLPMRSRHCDYVFCTNAIDHIPSPEHGMQELARILKPGGTLYLHVHFRRKDELNKGHVHKIDGKVLVKWYKAAGLKIKRFRVCNDYVNSEKNRRAAFVVLEKA